MVWGHVNIMGAVGPEGCQLSVWGGCSHTSSTRVIATRGDAGTIEAVVTQPLSRLEGIDKAMAIPCLWSEWGFLLTFERPIGDIAFLCPPLAVGGVEG